MGDTQELHIVFFPLLAHGHMIPMFDIARLFASRGVKATFVTTTLNAPNFTKAIEKRSGETITPVVGIEVFNFPAEEAGLPQGYENLGKVIHDPELLMKFHNATNMLQEQLEQYVEKTRPNFLIADMFYPWVADSAAKFGIPWLAFDGSTYFVKCAGEVIRLYEPHKNVSSHEEKFVLPGIPHEVKVTRSQLDEDKKSEGETDFKKTMQLLIESAQKSYGMIFNSFYELEPEYADLYRNKMKIRAWNIGPVSLCNRSIEDKARWGKQVSVDGKDCLRWLNMKKSGSVVYLSFGSMVHLTTPQLLEIAKALEASSQYFIWVVPDGGNIKNDQWLPPGFEERTEGKCLIIRGWAPQVPILEHEAVGAFVTHCGWNSALEAISAGVPMVTWPIFGEQFFNEMLVAQILKIGVPVGVKRWNLLASSEEVIEKDAIDRALKEIMIGEEAPERRCRAKKLKELAWNAVDVGGSSYSQLTSLTNELKSYHA